MTRKHYKYLAQMMGEILAGRSPIECEINLMLFLKKDNPRFDNIKFSNDISAHANDYYKAHEPKN
jgi:hypothetical protein